MVIATVFLTIIGMTAGFMLGEQRRRQQSSGTYQAPTETASDDALPSTDPSGKLCPPETLQLAVRDGFPSQLWQVMRVKTENGTTVWICQDYRGRHYFQSKTGGFDAPLKQGVNALFLSDVAELGHDDYQATSAEGNTFHVNREKLQVRFTSGRPTLTSPVIAVE